MWTAGDARACELSRDEIRTRVRHGLWQVLRRGVYADGGVVPCSRMRAWAAVLAAGGVGRAWATGRTALRLFDLPLIDDEDPATGAQDFRYDDVVVTAHVRARGTLRPKEVSLPPGDLGQFGDCPCVRLPIAFLHAAGVLSFEALVCALDAALHRGLLTTGDLTRFLDASTGARHVATMRRAVAAADGRAESPLETLGRLLLLPVLPELRPQVEVRDADGRLLARVDLGDEGRRLAVEGDGRAVHAGMAADDHRRDRRIRGVGWHTERYTWFEVRRQQAALRERIVTEARRRGAR